MIAVERECQGAVEPGIVRIADGSHGRQPVECAAQHNCHEPHVASAGRMGEAGHEGPGEAAAASRQKGAARERWRFTQHGDYLR